MAPKKKMNKCGTKSEKGESSKTKMPEPITPIIHSPLNSLDVPKQWFENHTAYERWIDIFRQRSLSYVDILDYNFFLFEDLEIISTFIQSTHGMLLNPGSSTYPALVKVFYSNLSFTMIDGNQALRSFVKGQELIISKTLMMIKLLTFWLYKMLRICLFLNHILISPLLNN